MAQKASAPGMERMQPETLMRSLLILMTCSASLLSGRNPQVMGEPEIVIGAVAHPGCQGMPLSLQLAAAGGVQDDPGVRGVAEPAAVLFQDFRVDGIVPGSAGGIGGLLRLRQRVDGLPH